MLVVRGLPLSGHPQVTETGLPFFIPGNDELLDAKAFALFLSSLYRTDFLCNRVSLAGLRRIGPGIPGVGKQLFQLQPVLLVTGLGDIGRACSYAFSPA